MRDAPAVITRRQVRLPDGTAAVVRPIAASDTYWLKLGLEQRLSQESRMRRFLYNKRAYTSTELEEFTRFEPSRHLALVLAITDAFGNEVDVVAVARCFRDPVQPTEAEFAITTVDEWQRRGIGTILVQELAACAWELGIRRWHAIFVWTNESTRKLLNRVADLETENWLTADCIEGTYALRPPASEALGDGENSASRRPT